MRTAVVNLKGGTAKSTSAMFLAAALSKRGRTLLVDCDPQGSALTWAEAAEEDGGELGFNVVSIPTRDVKKRVDRMAGDYAHVVLDTPPGELDIVRAALHAADVALIAISPSDMDINRFRPTLELVAEVEAVTDLDYRVLLTMVRRISREGRDARAAMEALDLPVLQTEVPFLGFYRSAFGETIDELGDYEGVADELLGARV
ncbi:MAG: ParA family protein [Actinomycetota bacterium]|nr:ParA family protein [Actinomycetota bacterium]